MGYVWNWKLYTGKEDEAGSEPLGERVVTGLLTGLEHKGYHVYLTTIKQVHAYASISIPRVLAAVVLFGWTGEISQKPSEVPLVKRVRLPRIMMMSSLG